MVKNVSFKYRLVTKSPLSIGGFLDIDELYETIEL